ncbi:transmembrane protein 192 isoform X2 [Mugil cephalus]|uniref:transmembrane protein 192 isoform X2 n=1 Tax=Mugil cephalus TaxID=48193 RepID=UPI001FB6BE71|nr:transmembrane protein 192 isoform X2 [Mugil cephalus]
MGSKGPWLYAAGPSVDMTRSTEEDSVDGPLISADALQSAIRREFQTLPTPCHAVLLSLLHVLYVVLSICVAVLCILESDQEEMCKSFLGNVKGDSVIVFAKVCLWALVLLFTAYVQHHHNRARSRGYLRFYREMQPLKHLPLVTHSSGNVLLLLLLAARLAQSVHIYMLLSILGCELLVAVPSLLYYAVKVFRYNRERSAPDVSQEDLSHTYSVTSLPTETGFRGSSSLEEVVEKQADLIEYLKQHNTLLSKRLLNLTAQH